MTAFAYLRKSVVHNAEKEVSPAMQEAAVQDLAGRHGDNHGALVVLSDLDKSGRLGREKRPGYDALLTAIEEGRCTAVYSYSLSRLGRSVQELARLIADCDKRGIPVRLVRDAIDTSTASGKAMAHMLMTMAQFESDVASERQLDANTRKRAEGRPVGTTRFYGDVPGEDPAVVLAAFHEAGSYNGAARLLNERGIKPRNRKVWWASAVRHVVQRLDPTVIVRKDERSSAPIAATFLLSRLLRCPWCGAFLTGGRPTRGTGRAVRYACRQGSTLPHGLHSIAESAILPAIRVEAELLSPGGSVIKTKKGTSGDYDALAAKRERVLVNFEDGLIDKTRRDERLAAVDAEIEKVQDRRVLLIRPRLSWTWGSEGEDTRVINRALRDLWSEVRLDQETMQPVKFEWRVPEWRAK